MIKLWHNTIEYLEKSDFHDVVIDNNKIALAPGKLCGYARFRFQTDNVSEWQNLEWTNNYLYPIGKVKVRIRSNDTANLNYADFSFPDSVEWTSYFVDTPVKNINILYVRNTRYFEMEVYLETSDRALCIPTINGMILEYRPDTDGPDKVETLSVWKSGRNVSPTFAR